ncbi:hypothetical protein [Azospirillum sp. TSO5]|uniref:hypothetical protein n=1 Tax=Azospirillum sp. TSO5 TaxID=716760 RepID=UPI0011B25335|nr:hypothetical protein [Azospirillum sp. TSO5]
MTACKENPFLPENWSKPLGRHSRRALTSDELDRTVEIYRQKGASKAAEEIGIGIHGVYHRLRRAGAERDGLRRKASKANERAKVIASEVDLQMAALHDAGKSLREISRQFGVSFQRVHQRVSRAKSCSLETTADIRHYPEA